ncbi:S-formylglutathione hydrolase FrmB [Nocardia amikacinitolerans]|uniref:S-formylglutathione hydrolase FrmB n=1 Tax=Nocardia amikacinitolerans TaxID=756689 RepID=A0A285LV72_9NOCA|nr:alpha/beta hydrolase family protein [Nocardia amikacinitolerans]MCP2280072.1 S-formylglutathione hydrolase FrmB [Nocardia amikacinitolerans]MCP2299886.1 S-formylglutathione hydrolase FrmB [Nocardia amikacinitolerans]SNY88798.1 S-formylglutathione hydrolase FrmB [Nocardia amikacinitolerans]
MRGTRSRSVAAAAAVALLCGAGAAVGGNASAAATDSLAAQSFRTQADDSRIVDTTVLDERNLRLQVYSAAMGRTIDIDVQRPADASAPRPTLYLLAGAGGGEDTATWQQRTTALQFLATKDVNVVQPVGGAFTYYTDWRSADPALGVNKWQTFLTEELPPLIDRALGTNGTNAIAGLSMSGTSVLQLPIAAPGLYRAAAAYSGCAQISDPVGYNFVKTVVSAGGGDTANMYGPQNDPLWAANDPYLNAEGLRGLELFLSTGTGIPGQWDTLDGPYALPGVGGLANQLTVGGALEAASNYCTHNMQTRLNELGIPATFDFQPVGTHSWGYWEDALVASWPVLARGLGLPA